MCSHRYKLEKFTKNCTKTLLQWNENTFLHWRHAFTPKDFQMHQQLLDHSYTANEKPREQNLRILTQSVMILVARLGRISVGLGSGAVQCQTNRIHVSNWNWLTCSIWLVPGTVWSARAHMGYLKPIPARHFARIIWSVPAVFTLEAHKRQAYYNKAYLSIPTTFLKLILIIRDTWPYTLQTRSFGFV
jgi:hypothetical protein